MNGHQHEFIPVGLSRHRTGIYIEHGMCACGEKADKPLNITPPDEEYLSGQLHWQSDWRPE